MPMFRLNYQQEIFGMKATANTGQYMPSKENKTTINFDPSDNLWHAWSSNPEHIEKMVGSRWELMNVDAEGASFTAPEHALQICVASGKKLSARERREREADLYRVQANAILERRREERNGK